MSVLIFRRPPERLPDFHLFSIDWLGELEPMPTGTKMTDIQLQKEIEKLIM